MDNKLDIRDTIQLEREEERISKLKALQLFDLGLRDTLTPGTFESLSYIHYYLFCDIYDFAGKIRDVNIAKGHFRFASVMYLTSTIESIEKMPQNTFDQIVEKYVEMNIAHPFREGNGRSMRIWLDLMLKKELSQVIDWSLIDKEDYLQAIERSHVKDIEIKHLLQEALTNDIHSRDVYMKGIDYSYSYEGLNYYQLKDISE